MILSNMTYMEIVNPRDRTGVENGNDSYVDDVLDEFNVPKIIGPRKRWRQKRAHQRTILQVGEFLKPKIHVP